MVISVNPDPNKKEFEKLLRNTLTSLQSEAINHPQKYEGLLGNKLENEVETVMNNNAKGTPFEGSIELVSGQKFPDIIAQKYYGIEVKTTQSKHWRSTGSSIAEGTRVDGIARIFMLFGKMCNPIEFMCKPYEECLSEVVVTHSPRYLIDMKLLQGQTIFDKIEIPYDELRKHPNPIKTVLNYYRTKLKPGDDIWWLDQDSSRSTSLIIRLWNNLTVSERNEYMLKGFSFFPELISSRNDKFNKLALWLSTREGIVCPNVRDIFTAGGRGYIKYRTETYANIPRVVINLYSNIEAILEIIKNTQPEELSEFWNYEVNEKNKLSNWLKLIVDYSKSILKTNLPLAEIIEQKIQESRHQ